MIFKTSTGNVIVNVDNIDVMVKIGDRVNIAVNGLGMELTEKDGQEVWDIYHWAKKDFMYGPDKKKIEGGK
jgi:hypothetical protein